MAGCWQPVNHKRSSMLARRDQLPRHHVKPLEANKCNYCILQNSHHQKYKKGQGIRLLTLKYVSFFCLKKKKKKHGHRNSAFLSSLIKLLQHKQRQQIEVQYIIDKDDSTARSSLPKYYYFLICSTLEQNYSTELNKLPVFLFNF